MTRRIRVVLDTSVLVSALISTGHPRTVVELCRRHEVVVLTSDAILTELVEVLRRKLRWSGEQVAVLQYELRSFALVVVPGTAVRCVREDPADDRILECALEGEADFIVTGNTRHLQPLGTFQEIPIVSPAAFLLMIGLTADS